MRKSIVMEFADGWHIERRESYGIAKSYLVKGEIETLLSPEEERRICMTKERRGTETIVAAAIRVPVSDELRALTFNGKPAYPYKLVITAPPPARHHHLLAPMHYYGARAVEFDDQGFITSTGRYVDRVEALQIALSSGQPMIDHSSRHGTWLFSEDLW